MAILQNTMMTDTGTSSSVVKPTASTSTTTTAKTPTSTSSTGRRTTSSAAPTATTAVQNNNTNKKKTNTYGYSSSSSTTTTSTPAPAEETPDYWVQNYQNYNNDLDKSYNSQYQAEKDSANAYLNAVNKNLDSSANQWKKTYKEVEKLLTGLESQNKARESTMNQAISDAYNQLMGNANDYYQSVIDAYNRSRDVVNSGFNEGKSTTEKARDEALKLAADLYSMGEQTQNQQTEKDLRSQYISYMNGMRNLNQQLASAGINGGASESAMLSALNNYGTNRTSLDEARLAGLAQLRQQQMQSGSEAQQTYLNALADLITNRTNQLLGVENTRSSGEYNFANMKNDAANTRSNQTLQAQQAYQQWANDLVNQRSGNKTNYATAVQGINSERNAGQLNYQNMYANAAANRSNNASSTAKQNVVKTLSEHNGEYKSNLDTSNTTKKEKKAAQKKKDKKAANKTAKATYDAAQKLKKDAEKQRKKNTTSSSKKASNAKSDTKSNTSSKKKTSTKKTTKEKDKKKKK